MWLTFTCGKTAVTYGDLRMHSNKLQHVLLSVAYSCKTFIAVTRKDSSQINPLEGKRPTNLICDDLANARIVEAYNSPGRSENAFNAQS